MKQKPFTVMCFKPGINPDDTNLTSPLVVGDEYTVIDQDVRILCGKVRKLYLTAEVKGFWFDARLFATLPPDEPAVVNEREFEGVIYAR